MAREHPSVPKASSSQKRGMLFDGESDDEDNAGAQSKKVALSKKQSAPKDMSNLFVKEINGEEQPIQFYIVENDADWDATVDLRNQITDCGGECVEERPKEGYTLVDPRTEEGELEISSFSTPKRRVVSFRFVEESIKRGSLVPTVELVLFIKEDRPVKFHLHDSLKEEEIERLRDDILLRGGNPDVELSEAQVVIHSRDFRDKLIVNRRWRQIELFETSDWLRSCMTMKRFSITGAGGRVTVAPAPRPVPAAQPGRRPGAPRTDFTDHDDMCLVIWMAYQFGKNHAGRQGNRPYQVLVQDPDQTWWTSRHTWHSWRERYKNKRAHLDPLIIQAVNEREQNRKPNHRERRLPKFPDSDDESEVEQEGAAQEVAAPETEPSKTRPNSKPRKRKTQVASDDEDEQPEPKPAPAKQVERVTKRIKVGSQPNPAIKVSASQKAREAPPPRTPTPPPSSQARPSPGPPLSGPPSPGPESPRAIVVPVREESPVTQPDEDQERGDSQSSTQLENGILDQAVFGGGARGAVERHNAELARMVADEFDELNESEGYTFDDPDVDVVGITQVDSSPSINVDLSRQTGADESTTESTSEWGEDEEAGETGETVLDTIEERLTALADGFGAMYSKVEAYYRLARGDGMDEAAAYDFAEKQLRANSRQEKGKGRAS